APSKRFSNPLHKHATSSHQTSAEISSRLPGMLQIKWTVLWNDGQPESIRKRLSSGPRHQAFAQILTYT
ncbi:hypothetical protein, partial [Halovulum sp. GXIMD14793]